MIQQPIVERPARDWRDDTMLRPPENDDLNQVLIMLEAHGRQEGAALETYRRLAEEADVGPSVQYLVKLILEDETRHHRVLAEMANQIKSFLWELDVQPQLPRMGTRPNDALLEQTRTLLKFEKKDAKELRALRKQVKRSIGSSLHPLLVELMIHDTAKHIAILEHVRDRLRGR